MTHLQQHNQSKRFETFTKFNYTQIITMNKQTVTTEIKPQQYGYGITKSQSLCPDY